MMSLDEQKVKLLLHNVAAKLMQCVPVNVYTREVWGEIDKMIADADLTAPDLLTEKPGCATVKHQQQGRRRHPDDNLYQ